MARSAMQEAPVAGAFAPPRAADDGERGAAAAPLRAHRHFILSAEPPYLQHLITP